MKFRTLIIGYLLIVVLISLGIALVCVKGCQYVNERGLKDIGTKIWEGDK